MTAGGALGAALLRKKLRFDEQSEYISNQESSRRRRTRERAKYQSELKPSVPLVPRQDTMYQVPVEEEVINEQGQVISKSTVLSIIPELRTRQDVIRAMVNMLARAAGNEPC